MNIYAVNTRPFSRQRLQDVTDGSTSGGKADVQILSHRMGLSAQADLRERYPAVSIIIASTQQIRDLIDKALELGATVFAPKSANVEDTGGAAQLVLAAGPNNPTLNAQLEVTHCSVGKVLTAEQSRRSRSDMGLTARQVDVLALLLQGKSNKAICRVLDLAEPTVKNHVTAILRTLKVSNRTEAVLAVKDMGWEAPLRRQNAWASSSRAPE